MHPLLRRTAAALSLIFAASVHADELQDINRMMRQGQLPQALERVDKYLAGKPRDAQGRFLKGLILTEMNRPNDAIQVFSDLSKDYPELPEPYNNLAVLYAAQGQYEKARIALEASIRTHPSYATAHENLGDLYAKLASQAYDKALQLDSTNTGAKTKLAMIGELISSGGRGARSAARPEVKPPEVAAPSAPVGAKAPQGAKAADGSKASVVATAETKAAAPSAASAAKATAAAKAPEPKAAEVKPAEPNAPQGAKAPEAAKPAASKETQADDILKAVHAWASAWAKKDSNAYLAHYARDFKTPKGESRADWEKARRQRIAAPKRIEVSIESPKVSMSSSDAASVTFRQIYRSDVLKTAGTKTLVMVKANGKWLIREERVN